jgi:hypothetical protein
VNRLGGKWWCSILEFGQCCSIWAKKFVWKRDLEDAHGLAEFHRATLELTEGFEDLLSRSLLDF